jgi:hypothetical protein
MLCRELHQLAADCFEDSKSRVALAEQVRSQVETIAQLPYQTRSPASHACLKICVVERVIQAPSCITSHQNHSIGGAKSLSGTDGFSGMGTDCLERFQELLARDIRPLATIRPPHQIVHRNDPDQPLLLIEHR